MRNRRCVLTCILLLLLSISLSSAAEVGGGISITTIEAVFADMGYARIETDANGFGLIFESDDSMHGFYDLFPMEANLGERTEVT